MDSMDLPPTRPPRILYDFSSLENRVARRYCNVVLSYAATYTVDPNGPKAMEIGMFVQRTFASVLHTRQPLGRLVTGESRTCSKLIIVDERLAFDQIFRMQIDPLCLFEISTNNVHHSYIFPIPPMGGGTSTTDWCDAPVKLMVTLRPAQLILAFSFYKPLFGDEAQSIFLQEFIDHSLRLRQGVRSLLSHPLFSRAAAPCREEAPEALDNDVNVGVGMEMALVHDIYVPSTGSLRQPTDWRSVEWCTMKLLLAGDKMERLGLFLGSDVPDTILGYSKAQIAAAALTWVAVTETRLRLYKHVRELLSGSGSARLDMLVSAHHVCTDSDYDAPDMEAQKWLGNATCPVVTRMRGPSFGLAPPTSLSINFFVVRSAMDKIANSMKQFNRSAVRNLARKTMIVPYLVSRMSYMRAVNVFWDGFCIENCTGHDYRGMGGFYDDELYPRASVAHSRKDNPPGFARLLPQVDDEDNGNVVVLLTLSRDEMEMVEQKLSNYLASS